MSDTDEDPDTRYRDYRENASELRDPVILIRLAPGDFPGRRVQRGGQAAGD